MQKPRKVVFPPPKKKNAPPSSFPKAENHPTKHTEVVHAGKRVHQYVVNYGHVVETYQAKAPLSVPWPEGDQSGPLTEDAWVDIVGHPDLQWENGVLPPGVLEAQKKWRLKHLREGFEKEREEIRHLRIENDFLERVRTLQLALAAKGQMIDALKAQSLIDPEVRERLLQWEKELAVVRAELQHKQQLGEVSQGRLVVEGRRVQS